MLQSHQIEELMKLVMALDRERIIEQFHNFRATFPVDFTRDFLETQSLERLRHIFVAMCLQQQRMPEIPLTNAA
jgi:hypothetical protein